MAHQVKVLPTKPDSVTIHQNHVVEGENQLTQTAPDLHTVRTYTDIYITN